CRHRQNIQSLEKFGFRLPVDNAAVPEFAGIAPLGHLLFDSSQICTVFAREIAGDLKPHLRRAGPLTQPPVRIAQNMQPFLWSDPRQVHDNKRARALSSLFRIAVKRYAKWNHMHFAIGYTEVLRHEASIILAHRQEPIDKFNVGPNQIERLGSVAILEPFDE